MSRLEERIRYVADGRERLARQRAELEAQSAAWRARESRGRRRARAHRRRARGRRAQRRRRSPRELDARRRRRGAGSSRRCARRRRRSQAQRGAVAAVQQQIQVSAAEARGVDERLDAGRGAARAAARRRPRAWSRSSRPSCEPARERAAAADARHAAALATVEDWQARMPALDEARRALQDRVNDEGRRHAELGARLGALQALQEKVQVENKLKPWLVAPWPRVARRPVDADPHRARLGSRRSRRRCASGSARSRSAASTPCAPSPPTRRRRAWPSSRRRRRATPASHRTLPRLADLLHLGDAGLAALLGDWLEGVYTADDLDAALAARSSLTHGEVIMTREGHAVSQFAVSFYAPDSEQAGLLARAQEIENLQRQTRAQALVVEESRSRLVRAEAAAPRPATHLAASAARCDGAAVAGASRAGRAAAPDASSPSRRSRGATSSAASAPPLEAELAELGERRRASEARFEALDAELGVAQERQAELDEALLAGRAAALERGARRAARARAPARRKRSSSSARYASRREELERAIASPRAQQLEANQARDAAPRRRARPAHRRAGAGRAADGAGEPRSSASSALGEKRSLYDDLSQGLRARRRGAARPRAGAAAAARPASARCSSRRRRRSSAARSTSSSSRRQAPIARRSAAAIEEGGVKLAGLQGAIDALNRDIEALGAVNLAALEELGQARERKGFLDAQNADLGEAMDDARGRDPQDRPRDARAARHDLRPGQRAFRPHVPDPLRRRQRHGW